MLIVSTIQRWAKSSPGRNLFDQLQVPPDEWKVCPTNENGLCKGCRRLAYIWLATRLICSVAARHKKTARGNRAAKLFCQGLYTIQLVLGLDCKGFSDVWIVWISKGLDSAVGFLKDRIRLVFHSRIGPLSFSSGSDFVGFS